METYKLKTFEDDRGDLTPIEFKYLPFTPKRIFIVNNVPTDSIRGKHAHYKTNQYLICINGVIDVILHDGNNETVYRLNKSDAILVPELIWDSQKFLTYNAELLVICSTDYDINDYINDFNEFKKIKNNELV